MQLNIKNAFSIIIEQRFVYFVAHHKISKKILQQHFYRKHTSLYFLFQQEHLQGKRHCNIGTWMNR